MFVPSFKPLQIHASDSPSLGKLGIESILPAEQNSPTYSVEPKGYVFAAEPHSPFIFSAGSLSLLAVQLAFEPPSLPPHDQSTLPPLLGNVITLGEPTSH